MSLLAFKLVEASGIPKIYSKCYIWLSKIIGLNTVVANEWLLPANRTKGIPKKLYIGSSIFHWFTIPTPNFHYYDEMYVVCVGVCWGCMWLWVEDVLGYLWKPQDNFVKMVAFVHIYVNFWKLTQVVSIEKLLLST